MSDSSWSHILLGDLVDGFRGVSYKPEDLLEDYSDNSVVLLRANNIQEGRIRFEDVQYVPKNLVKDNQILEQGDIAVCMSNGSKVLVGKSAQYNGKHNALFTVGAFCSIFKVEGDVVKNYVQFLFSSQVYQQHIDVLLAGSAINNLKNSDIESIAFSIPTKNVQEKIIQILGAIDKAIEQTESLIHKYQQIKAGLMHDLFTRGVTADWKLRPPREQAPELYKETDIGWIPKKWIFSDCSKLCEKIIDCQ